MTDLLPCFRVVMIGFVMALGLEIFWLKREYAAAHRVRLVWNQRVKERDALVEKSPPPEATDENLLSAELAEVERSLAAGIAGWQNVSSGQDGLTPELSLEGFLALSEFVTRNRRLAQDMGVVLSPNERFGFEAYGQKGPPAAQLPAIHRQMAEADILLRLLLTARPRALLVFHQDVPNQRGPALPAARNSAAGDLPPGFSLESPGLVATDAFRMEFTGRTQVLHSLLADLAKAEQPMVVRSVEVEPEISTAERRDKGDSRSDPSNRSQFSRFRVVVEVPRLIAGGPQS